MVENAGKMEKEYIKKVKLSLISRSKNIYIYISNVIDGGSTKLAQTSVRSECMVYTAMRDTSCVVKLDPIHPVHLKL